MMTDVNPQRRREYHSPTREQRALATRRRIRLAAERLFLRDGYLPTTMAKIAAEAGVAEKTVYLAFPTKADLLNEIIRVGVRGDEDSTPLSRRAEWGEMRTSRSVDRLLDQAAARNAALMARAAHFLALGEASATIDPQLAELRDRGHQNIHSDMRELATALAAIDPRIDPERLAETLFAFAANESPYLRLTEECSWPQQQYAAALRAILAALVDHATS
jgi:AcrR family transcriptional regulator